MFHLRTVAELREKLKCISTEQARMVVGSKAPNFTLSKDGRQLT